MTDNPREFITSPDPNQWPHPWVVVSSKSYDNYDKPLLVESYTTKDRAIAVGRYRHEQGYIVTVYQTVAFTVGMN